MMYPKLISSSRHPHIDTTKYNMTLRIEQIWQMYLKSNFVPAIRKYISPSRINSRASIVGILETIDNTMRRQACCQCCHLRYIPRNMYLWSKANIWNVNCARTTSFIFDTRKIKIFKTENLSTWEGLEPPTSGFMPNALTIWAIRARHLLSHVVEYWLWWYRYFSVRLTCGMLTVRGQQHSFSIPVLPSYIYPKKYVHGSCVLLWSGYFIFIHILFNVNFFLFRYNITIDATPA